MFSVTVLLRHKTDWIYFDGVLWVCYFPTCILGQVWYLIVSIPDLCTLTYFVYAYKCQDGIEYVFVTLPCVILGQVWYLIVSIPYLCRLSYFVWVLVILSINLSGHLLMLVWIDLLYLSSTRFFFDSVVSIKKTNTWPCSQLESYEVITQWPILYIPEI